MKYPKRSQYKYAKSPYRIRNWADYEAGLQRRGDVTIWFSDEAIRSWKAAASGRPGGQRVYADVAIEASLMVRMVFHLPLRQTEGFLRSLATMLDLNIAIPDHTTLSRRSQGLAKLPLRPSTGKRPIHILADSTGLRIHMGKRAPVPKRRAWRNLHVAVDAETGEVVASDLTSRRAADPRHLPKLLEQIDRPLASARADAAYDTEDVYETIHAAGGGSDVRILIPPTRRAQLRRRPSPALKERNGSIRLVRRLGRRKWEKQSGYSQRSMEDNTIYRYKRIVGGQMRARSWDGQNTEAWVGCRILNTMAALGMPDSYKAG